MTPAATVTVNITAGPIQATGVVNERVGHQVAMGDNLHIHISPAIAKQWVAVLETITKEGNA